MDYELDIKLDFKDVLIKPKISDIESRSQINLIREFSFSNGVKWSGIPIIASNMDTVGTYELYKVLSSYQMITALHKFYTLEQLLQMELDPNYFMISTGITNLDYIRLIEILDNINVKFICIDVANGYMSKLQLFCKKIKEMFPSIVIAAGNVVTQEITEILVSECGVDIVKVGIGNGSVCTTRIKTGVGIPQISAINNCAGIAHSSNSFIISDGGITCPGDLAKAFGAGADFIMIGGAFSGHAENPGNLITDDNGEKYKLFYGMSSNAAMNKYYNGKSSYKTDEGKIVKIKYKGPISNTINDYLGGLRSSCSYIGAFNIDQIFSKTTFVIVKNQYNDIFR